MTALIFIIAIFVAVFFMAITTFLIAVFLRYIKRQNVNCIFSSNRMDHIEKRQNGQDAMIDGLMKVIKRLDKWMKNHKQKW
ncbi:MAG: hypothetical protein JRI77_11725 [Deltaproteobacteria bacterium]|nr:hypothetical protein [Deltaproteobacteria bacterium]